MQIRSLARVPQIHKTINTQPSKKIKTDLLDRLGVYERDSGSGRADDERDDSSGRVCLRGWELQGQESRGEALLSESVVERSCFALNRGDASVPCQRDVHHD